MYKVGLGNRLTNGEENKSKAGQYDSERKIFKQDVLAEEGRTGKSWIKKQKTIGNYDKTYVIARTSWIITKIRESFLVERKIGGSRAFLCSTPSIIMLIPAIKKIIIPTIKKKSFGKKRVLLNSMLHRKRLKASTITYW